LRRFQDCPAPQKVTLRERLIQIKAKNIPITFGVTAFEQEESIVFRVGKTTVTFAHHEAEEFVIGPPVPIPDIGVIFLFNFKKRFTAQRLAFLNGEEVRIVRIGTDFVEVQKKFIDFEGKASIFTGIFPHKNIESLICEPENEE
jgi:hypothetical protein